MVANKNKKGWFDLVIENLPCKWLERKRHVDDVGGLWRIHDGLYDVTEFINVHPGGKFWLEETKGTDVTELFEIHHIQSNVAEQIMKQFFVKKISTPRSSPYTFRDDGFYRTIKRRGMEKIKTFPKEPAKKSDLYVDLLLLGVLTFACLANAFSMYIFAVIAGILGGLLVIGTHNYMHRRDNFRMYYEDIFMLSTRTFRIMHIISHHAFPNTTLDFQISIIRPMANSFPEKKNFFTKYLPWLITTIIGFPFILHILSFLAILECFVCKQIFINAFLPLVVPVVMHIIGGQSWIDTFCVWQVVMIFTSFVTALIGYATTHIHPDLHIEGDANRPDHELDFGINQLDTTCDKKEVLGNHFLTLVTYGDHGLHHLFPTLDHGYLHYLYPLLTKTLKEFKLNNFHIKPQVDLYLGFYRQAAREEPKLVSPSLHL